MSDPSVQKTTPHAEYLRRNLLVCKAIGALANTETALARLRAQRRPPRWLVEALEGVRDRVAPLSADLAAWRATAPDAPTSE